VILAIEKPAAKTTLMKKVWVLIGLKVICFSVYLLPVL